MIDSRMKLGFGLMRLPKKSMTKTDQTEFENMVDSFIEQGGTYFDTAYVYGSSEKDTAKALVKRYPRDSFTLASKLNALVCLNEKQARNQFEKSLKRTEAGYFDYYLLHALMRSNYKRYDKFHLWDFGKEMKEKGLIKNLGFSFHGDPELLDQILSAHPEVDFVQLQINYADWEDKKVQSRANYEIARKHGKDIVVMEPVKGGKLANPPKEILDLFRSVNPEASAASWAIRFVASLDGVKMVLSGMSNMEQMEDNLSYMKDFKPLTEEEWNAIHKAQEILGKQDLIGCTECHYCLEHCPKGIEIPEVLKSLNDNRLYGSLKEPDVKEGNGSFEDCISCRACERACPQHIEIADYMREARNIYRHG